MGCWCVPARATRCIPSWTTAPGRGGVRSAESEPVAIDWGLLDTPTWAEFASGRGFGRTRPLPEQMAQLGLAEKVAGEWMPRCAAVLLFAEEPGGLLAAQIGRG